MSAHTPGPWSAFSDGNHTNIVAYAPRTTCVFSLPGRHKGEADVRLIAAAPTMYEYIASSASNGCAEAAKIMEAIYGSR